MHEAAVNVGVEQVRHGLHGAVTQRAEVGDAALAGRVHGLVLFLLRTIVQQVHEQCQISGKEYYRFVYLFITKYTLNTMPYLV